MNESPLESDHLWLSRVVSELLNMRAVLQCFPSFNSHRVEIVLVTLDMQKSCSVNEQWIDQCFSEAIIAFLLSF